MADLKTKKTISVTSAKRGSAQQYSSPTFKAIAADYTAGKITSTQAINKIVPKGTPEKLRTMVAEALGVQIGRTITAKSQQKVNEQSAKKKQTRKRSK